MKFKTKRTELIAALSTAKRAVGKGDKPILTNVLLRAIRARSGGLLVARATDLEVYAEHTIDGDADGSFSALVDPKPILSFLANVDAPDVTLGKESKRLVVHTEEATFYSALGDVEEYPEALQGQEVTRAELGSVRSFRTAVERVLPLAAKVEGRYALNGVLFELGPRASTLATTDGRRLGEVALSARSETEASEIMPNAMLSLFLAIAPKARSGFFPDQTVEIVFTENGTTLSWGGIRISARSLAGEFPNYRAVKGTRDQQKFLVRVPVERTKKALKRVEPACSPEAKAVRFEFSDASGLVLSTKSYTTEAISEVSDVEFSGDPDSFALNPEYALDVLRLVGTDRVEIGWRDRQSPIHFFAGDATYVVMPITIDS